MTEKAKFLFILLIYIIVLPKWIKSETQIGISTTQSPAATNSFLKSVERRVAALTVFIPKLIKRLPSELVKEIPNVADVLSATKQVFVGMPLELLSAFWNKFCSSSLKAGALNPPYTPSIDEMNLYFFGANNNASIPLSQPEKLFEVPDFDKNRGISIYISGWFTTIYRKPLEFYEVYDAYRCRGTENFITLDNGVYLDTLTSWSSVNTEIIGNYVGEAISKLTKHIPTSKFHLIGHSMGGQIVGHAARRFYDITGELLPRVTGLDPAKPCFNEGEDLNGIQRGVAKFVDVIHTDSGILGKREPVGDADFYPNGVIPIQPGCLEFICSHLRSIKFYAESVYPGNERNFLAVQCNSKKALRINKCRGPKVSMGYAAPTNIKGNYFLETNAHTPYGKNANLILAPKCLV